MHLRHLRPVAPAPHLLRWALAVSLGALSLVAVLAGHPAGAFPDGLATTRPSGAPRPNPLVPTSAESRRQAEVIPAELAPTALLAMQADAPSTYDITALPMSGTDRQGRKSGPGVYAATSADQGLDVTFDATTVRVGRTRQPNAPPLVMRMSGFGTPSRVDGLRPGIISTSGNRIELARAQGGDSTEVLREWYVNGRLGLEQGVTIAGPPRSADGDARADSALQLEFEVDPAWVPTLTPDGAAVVLTEPKSGATLHYGHLYAWDAEGQALPVTLAVDRQVLVLQVDASGARYPVTIDPLLQEAALTASDAKTGEFFGNAVSIDGDTAVIGSVRDDIGANADQGSAYVFVRTNGRWTQQAKLVLPNGVAGEFFGWSVAVSGDSVLVGTNFSTGISSVHAFERSGTTWGAPSPLRPTVNPGGAAFYFGHALGLRGGRAIVGSIGERSGPGNVYESVAYIFEKQGGSWAQRARLTATGATVGHDFGRSVAIDGDTVVVAASGESNGSVRSQGYVYVFSRSGGSWTQQDRFTANDATTDSKFGLAVAIRGTTIVATALNLASSTSTATAAAAYVFEGTGGSWTQRAKLMPQDTANVNRFGESVGLDSNQLIVGATWRNPSFAAQTQGAAYLYERSGSGWTQTDKLTLLPPTPNYDDPYAVSFSAGTALVGSLSHRYGTGAAFVFSATGAPPPPTGPPSAPVNVRATVSGNTINLTWGAPTGGAAPSGYTLLGRLAAGGPVLGTLAVGNGTAFSLVAPDGIYVLTVRAANASGIGPESAAVTVTVPQAAAAPGPPENLMASVSGTTVSLTWNAPSSGGAVGAYLLVAGLTPGFAVPAATAPLAPTPGFSVSGVAPGTYYIRVLAQNSGGTSPASNEVALTVAGLTAPGVPTLYAPVVNGSTVSLSWSSGPGGAPTGYTMVATATPGGAPLATVPLSGTTASFAGVPSGTFYLRLTASNAAGASPPSAEVVLTVP